MKELNLLDDVTNLWGYDFAVMAMKELAVKNAFCILLVRLDSYEEIIEEGGANSANQVLRIIGKNIREIIGELGKVYRWEGPVIAVSIPDQKIQFAEEIAEVIRFSIEEKSKKGTYSTVSIGISCVDQYGDFEEAKNKAEAALASAQKSGKNRVEVYKDISLNHRANRLSNIRLAQDEDEDPKDLISQDLKDEINRQFATEFSATPWNEGVEQRQIGKVPKPPRSTRMPSPGLHPQDDSMVDLHSALRNGYTMAEWILNEDHQTHKDGGICSALSGQQFMIDSLVTGLSHNAPIFETSHVGCKCRLKVFNPDDQTKEPYEISPGNRWA